MMQGQTFVDRSTATELKAPAKRLLHDHQVDEQRERNLPLRQYRWPNRSAGVERCRDAHAARQQGETMQRWYMCKLTAACQGMICGPLKVMFWPPSRSLTENTPVLSCLLHWSQEQPDDRKIREQSTMMSTPLKNL